MFAGGEGRKMGRSCVMRSVGQHSVIVLLLMQAGGLYDDCIMRLGLQRLGF